MITMAAKSIHGNFRIDKTRTQHTTHESLFYDDFDGDDDVDDGDDDDDDIGYHATSNT